ncbi:hypothetical protein Dimus_010439 [Dionaea muscipula]
MENDAIEDPLPPPPPGPSAPDGANNVLQKVRHSNGRTSGPTRRSTRGQWTPEEDEILRNAVQRFKGKNWKKIAECFKDRTDVQCLHRWQKVLNPELIKGPWTKEEDETIIQLVEEFGPKKWSTIAQHLPGRIGKQCRERWHNHLNPSINKEAWTQDEELILIHAHQIYGNKWAELTKFLPGRTDNAIKNHWNSSVKKKLDSYIASGLLARFKGLPIPSSSVRVQQSSGDEGIQKDGAEGEEISECSQSSVVVGGSQTARDVYNAVSKIEEEYLLKEDDEGREFTDHVQVTVDRKREPADSSTSSYCEEYCPSLENICYSVPETDHGVPCGFAYIGGNSVNEEYHFYADDIATLLSLELPPEQSGLAGDDCGFYTAGARLNVADDIADLGGYKDGSFLPSLSFHNNMGCATAETLQCQSLSSIPSEFSAGNGSKICSGILKETTDTLVEREWQELVASQGEGFTHFNISNCPLDDHIDVTDLTEPANVISNSSNLVSVYTFGDGPSDFQQNHPMSESPAICPEQQESGALCYAPPRFTSLDMPFVSCDLAQSATDGQQEYSPLGIRQMMMSSSINKLWDSPSSDRSPEAVLKSAAKTFACTPSILKKRHRDLLSPLSPFSERRFDKKVGDLSQRLLCTSSLTEEFSRLDVMFDGDLTHKASTSSPANDENSESEACLDDKENISPEFEGDEASKEDKENDCQGRTEEGFLPRGVLVERNVNHTQSACPNAGKGIEGEALALSDKAPEGVATLETAAKQGETSEPLSVNTKSVPTHPYSSGLVSCVQSIPSTAMAEGPANEVGVENLNIFGETPFRRSLESPSSWKSPWFFNSFLPGARFDADFTIEELGFFMSPMERSYDAIGLMKQINVQSADAYADAREVLGNDTPESILKQRCLKDQCMEQENNDVQDSEHGCHHLSSNITEHFQTEPRTLDFSECETPGKLNKGKSVCSISSSLSPSTTPSSLLKSFR